MWRACFVALVLAHGSAALYADQAGARDWTKQHVGGWSDVHWASASSSASSAAPGPSTATLLVASRATGTLAAVGNAQGVLEWRQLLPQDEQLLVVAHSDRVVCTVSYGGGASAHVVVRAWNGVSGKLHWETVVDKDVKALPRVADALIASAVTADGKERLMLLVAFDEVVLGMSVDSGRARWRFEGPTGVDEVSLGTSLGSLTVLWKSASSAHVAFLNVDDGKPREEFDVPDVRQAALANDVVVVAAKDPSVTGSVQLRLGVVHSASRVDWTPLHDVVASAKSGSIARINTRDAITFYQSSSGTGAVLTVGDDGKLVNSATFKGKPSVDMHIVAHVDDSGLHIGALQAQTELAVAFTSAKPNAAPVPLIPRVNGLTTRQHGELRLASLRSTASASHLILAFGDGYTCALTFATANAKIRWVREEALADVTHADFVELPKHSLLLTGADAEDEVDFYATTNVISALVHRWIHHAVVLRSLVERVVASVSNQDDDNVTEKAPAPTNELSRDTIGTRKMIVLLTSVGRVVGVSTWDGRIRWALTIPNQKLLKFEIVRAATTHDPVGVLVSALSDGTTGVLYIDPVAGRPSKEAPGGQTSHVVAGKHVWSSVLPSQLVTADHSHIHALVLVDDKLKASVVPSNAPASLAKPIYFTLVNSATGSIDGHRLLSSAEGLVVEPVWSFALQPREVLVSVDMHSPHEHVALPGRVLGNRQVLFKYVNPHLLAIASITPSTRGDGDGVLHMRLVDAVSGTLLDARYHGSARAPVTVTVTEHTVVYSFFNVRDQHTEVAVLELFESDQPDEKNEGAEFSSLDAFVPHILSQSYVVRTGITAAGVTQTRRGVTSRMFLFALSSSQIVGLNKRFLDPRRPTLPPTADDQAEWLIPYGPALPLDPKTFVSYNQTVARVRFIKASPALLESTSLVLCVGQDLFFSQLTPSLSFDSLPDDFDWQTMLVTVGALSIVTFVTSRFARRKLLADRWK